MHQNPSHGFARVQIVIGANLRNTVNPEKLLLMVMTDNKEYIHHTIHLSNISLPYNTINKTTNKKALGRLSHARGPIDRLTTIYILNHQISLLTLNRSVDSAVRPLVCSRMYTPCIRIHHIVSPECRMSSPPTSETQSIQKSYC